MEEGSGGGEEAAAGCTKRVYHEERQGPGRPSVTCTRPHWWSRGRTPGEIAIVTWNVQGRREPVVDTLPVLEGIMNALDRPIFLLQEVRNLYDEKRNCAEAVTASWLTMHRYEAFFGFTARRASDNTRFGGTRGAAVLLPTEHQATTADLWAEGSPNNKDWAQTDIVLVHLPRWRLRVASAYFHPTGLTDRHIMDVVGKLPPLTLMGADFNRALTAKEASAAEAAFLHELSTLAIDDNIMLIPPSAPTRGARSIDGFVMRHNKQRLPMSAEATVLDAEAISDHRPVALGVRGVHKTVAKRVESQPLRNRISTRVQKRFETEVRALAKTARTPEEAILTAVRRTIPHSGNGWSRRPAERTPGYQRGVQDILRRSDLTGVMRLVLPRRRPQCGQPIRHYKDPNRILVTNEEKALAGAEMIRETLYDNDSLNVAPQFDLAEILRDQEAVPLSWAEAKFVLHEADKKTAVDKHGIGNWMFRLLPLDVAREMLQRDYEQAWKGQARATHLEGRSVLIPKAGKDPSDMSQRRPIFIMDCIASAIDRVHDRRLATDVAKTPGVVHPGQTACLRGVPVDLQVHALLQLASNFAADGQQLFQPGGANGGTEAQLRERMEPEIQEYFSNRQRRPPPCNRIVSTRLTLVDQTAAYCRLSVMTVANRMSRYPLMRKYIPYLLGTNIVRGIVVDHGDARSPMQMILAGLGQGSPSSPRHFVIGSSDPLDAIQQDVDFLSCFLDDTNFGNFGRDPYVTDNNVQKALTRLGKEFDAAGLKAAARKIINVLINFGKRPYSMLPGAKKYQLQGLEVPVLNPGGKCEDARGKDQSIASMMERRTARHLGIYISPHGGFNLDALRKISIANKTLGQLVPFKYWLNAEMLRHMVFTKVLAVLLYGMEGCYSRLAVSTRDLLESMMAKAGRLITGACRNARNDLVLAAAGLPSFFDLVRRRVVTLDEKLKRLSPDFNPETGAYHETELTMGEMRNASSVPMMAKVMLSPRPPADRVDPRGSLSFQCLARRFDASALCSAAMASATMLRQPRFTSPPADGKITQLDVRHLRFNLSAPGGLTADDDIDKRRAACRRKLLADIKHHGQPQLEAYTDGGARLKEREGSAAAYGVWLGGQKEEEYENKFATEPQWQGSAPAGAAACSYSSEGWALLHCLRRVLQLCKAREIERQKPPERTYMRVVMDGKSFLDALGKGPLSQREWLEVQVYVAIAELVQDFDFCFAFVSIFGHSEINRNDHVDGLCTALLKDKQRALTPVPMRLCDCVNIRLRGAHPYRGAVMCPFGRGELLLPHKPSMDLGLDRKDEMRLNRLRTACAPEIGSVIHDQVSACRQCKKRVMNRMDAVRHMFECRAEAPELEREGLEPGDVWRDKEARRVLALARLFVNDGQESDDEGVHGDDPPDENEDSELLAQVLAADNAEPGEEEEKDLSRRIEASTTPAGQG